MNFIILHQKGIKDSLINTYVKPEDISSIVEPNRENGEHLHEISLKNGVIYKVVETSQKIFSLMEDLFERRLKNLK